MPIEIIKDPVKCSWGGKRNYIDRIKYFREYYKRKQKPLKSLEVTKGQFELTFD